MALSRVGCWRRKNRRETPVFSPAKVTVRLYRPVLGRQEASTSLGEESVFHII